TVLKTAPRCCAMAARRSWSCRATARLIAAASRSQRLVLPSISLKRKVTVPVGNAPIAGLRVPGQARFDASYQPAPPAQRSGGPLLPTDRKDAKEHEAPRRRRRKRSFALLRVLRVSVS